MWGVSSSVEEKNLCPYRESSHDRPAMQFREYLGRRGGCSVKGDTVLKYIVRKARFVTFPRGVKM
jgi:hypothetical protein